MHATCQFSFSKHASLAFNQIQTKLTIRKRTKEKNHQFFCWTMRTKKSNKTTRGICLILKTSALHLHHVVLSDIISSYFALLALSCFSFFPLHFILFALLASSIRNNWIKIGFFYVAHTYMCMHTCILSYIVLSYYFFLLFKD